MAIEHRIRWTPDGIILEHYDAERLVAEGKCGAIDDALAGLKIALAAEEEAYHFPHEKFPTADHVLAEKIARGIERRLP